MELDFITSVYDRLKTLSYLDISDSDKAFIGLIISKVENSILHKCNLTEVPMGLCPIMVNRVCGEFLWNQKQLGSLNGFDFDTAIKQINIGDTTVSYAIGVGDKTPEQRLDELLTCLMNTGEDEILCYRKLKW